MPVVDRSRRWGFGVFVALTQHGFRHCSNQQASVPRPQRSSCSSWWSRASSVHDSRPQFGVATKWHSYLRLWRWLLVYSSPVAANGPGQKAANGLLLLSVLIAAKWAKNVPRKAQFAPLPRRSGTAVTTWRHTGVIGQMSLVHLRLHFTPDGDRAACSWDSHWAGFTQRVAMEVGQRC